MFYGVTIFNPMLSLISFSTLPISEVTESNETVLASTAQVIGAWLQSILGLSEYSNLDVGKYFAIWVSIDAFVVLAGAVLTSFVGINGLMRRMAMDRCLPQVLLWRNKFTGTDSVILTGFFLLCVSQVLLMEADVEQLLGVYCYSFLSAMTIFALGNILLKRKRPNLPRLHVASWPKSIAGLVAVLIALMGNVMGRPELLTVFLLYFLGVGFFVFIMFQRVAILRFVILVLKQMSETSHENEYENVESTLLLTPPASEADVHTKVTVKNTCVASAIQVLSSVKDVPFIFYAKYDDLYLMNKAVLYVNTNEQTNRLIIVHCCGEVNGLANGSNSGGRSINSNPDGVDTKTFADHVAIIDKLYPKTKISLLIIQAEFTPGCVERLSVELGIPVNAMFISCPDEEMRYTGGLGGLRIITV